MSGVRRFDYPGEDETGSSHDCFSETNLYFSLERKYHTCWETRNDGFPSPLLLGKKVWLFPALVYKVTRNLSGGAWPFLLSCL